MGEQRFSLAKGGEECSWEGDPTKSVFGGEGVGDRGEGVGEEIGEDRPVEAVGMERSGRGEVTLGEDVVEVDFLSFARS